MKEKNPPGRPTKYSEEDPQDPLRVSMSNSFKTMIIANAVKECSGDASQYVRKAIDHYTKCRLAEVERLIGTTVTLENGITFVSINPGEETTAMSLMHDAKNIIRAAIVSKKLKKWHFRDGDGYAHISPELIDKLMEEYKKYDGLIVSIKEDYEMKAISGLFGFMVEEHESLKNLPEYIIWLGKAYGFVGPIIEKYKDNIRDNY